MRAFAIVLAVVGLVAAGPALAEKPADVTVADPANSTHEECKAVMGHKMKGRILHDHSAEKGAPKPPVHKELSKAEMDKMHAKCADKMAAKK